MPDRGGINVESVKLHLRQKFGVIDYAVFLLMLSSCSLIGIYFGFFAKKDKKSKEQDDYLVGGRTMKIFPIAMSLIARFVFKKISNKVLNIPTTKKAILHFQLHFWNFFARHTNRNLHLWEPVHVYHRRYHHHGICDAIRLLACLS